MAKKKKKKPGITTGQLISGHLHTAGVTTQQVVAAHGLQTGGVASGGVGTGHVNSGSVTTGHLVTGHLAAAGLITGHLSELQEDLQRRRDAEIAKERKRERDRQAAWERGIGMVNVTALKDDLKNPHVNWGAMADAVAEWRATPYPGGIPSQADYMVVSADDVNGFGADFEGVPVLQIIYANAALWDAEYDSFWSEGGRLNAIFGGIDYSEAYAPRIVDGKNLFLPFGSKKADLHREDWKAGTWNLDWRDVDVNREVPAYVFDALITPRPWLEIWTGGHNSELVELPSGGVVQVPAHPELWEIWQNDFITRCELIEAACSRADTESITPRYEVERFFKPFGRGSQTGRRGE